MPDVTPRTKRLEERLREDAIHGVGTIHGGEYTAELLIEAADEIARLRREMKEGDEFSRFQAKAILDYRDEIARLTAERDALQKHNDTQAQTICELLEVIGELRPGITLGDVEDMRDETLARRTLKGADHD